MSKNKWDITLSVNAKFTLKLLLDIQELDDYNMIVNAIQHIASKNDPRIDSMVRPMYKRYGDMFRIKINDYRILFTLYCDDAVITQKGRIPEALQKEMCIVKVGKRDMVYE